MIKINAVTLNRMIAQADEARLQGNVKLADEVHEIASSFSATDLWELEDYSHEQLSKDIKKNLWMVTAQLCRFYGTCPDISEANAVIKSHAQSLETLFKKITKASDLGINEPTIPGEDKKFEVEEDDE